MVYHNARWLECRLKMINPDYSPIIDKQECENKTFLVIWCPGGYGRPYASPKTMAKDIIELFSDKEKNRCGAQLIFTSHDLSTMNNEVYRRDEIWFAAKGRSQKSKLYSLVEFKNDKGESVRKDAKYDKQYLEGKYGADPYLQKIIDWSSPNA